MEQWTADRDDRIEQRTCSEIATDVCSGGAASDVGAPVTWSARYGTSALYRSIYASNVAGCNQVSSRRYYEKVDRPGPKTVDAPSYR